MKPSLVSLLAAALLAAGIGVAGWFVADGLREARTGDRFVTVKGLAEREVKADLALWPMRFVATSNALDEAQAKSRADAGAIIAFLTEAGIGRDEIASRASRSPTCWPRPTAPAPWRAGLSWRRP